jgi:hypothetical protein
MRTAPVVVLTQAEMFEDTGAAIAAVPTKHRKTTPARILRKDMLNLRGTLLGKSGTEAMMCLKILRMQLFFSGQKINRKSRRNTRQRNLLELWLAGE